MQWLPREGAVLREQPHHESASTELCSSTSELLGAVIKELFLPQLVLSAPNIGTIVLLAAEESLCGRMVEAIKHLIAVFAC